MKSNWQTWRRRILQGGVTAATGAFLMRFSTGNAATKPIELKAPRAVVWKDFLGLNVQFSLYTPAIRAMQVERLKALGLQWVRVGLHWMLVEPEEGKWNYPLADISFDLIRQNDLKAVVAVVGTPRYASSAPPGSPYSDKYPPRSPEVFAQRLTTLVQRYPQVDAWQVWNEPNIPGFWYPYADPEGYARLLAPAVAAIRSVAPGKTVVMAGMAYYSQMYGREGLMLQAMGKLGAYGLNLVAAYHPYTAVAEGADSTTRDFPTHAAFINTWLRASGVKQIWATEWGWSSYDGPKEEQPIIGEAGQADFTLKRLAMMAALDFDRIFLFTLADIDARAGVRDRRYGLLTEAGQPKPVYFALARFLAITGPRIEPDSPPHVAAALPAGLVSIGWKRPDGKKLWMVWSDADVALKLPDVRQATLHQPLTGAQSRLEAPDGVTVPVTTQLQILIGG